MRPVAGFFQCSSRLPSENLGRFQVRRELFLGVEYSPLDRPNRDGLCSSDLVVFPILDGNSNAGDPAGIAFVSITLAKSTLSVSGHCFLQCL
jgi:hypothetical protein